VETTLTWVQRLRRLCAIDALSQELVRFDTQLMQDAEVSGVGYQQGTLQGYEVREYVLEKFQRRCAYCRQTNVPMEVEHIMPKTRGGSDRVSNLTLACHSCNQRKGDRTAQGFGHPEVQAQARAPLKDAAAVNATRWALYRRLKSLGLPLEVGTGGCTKFNRRRLGLSKAHWLDAACVGASTPERLRTEGLQPLPITATGHGRRQMCGTDRYGFPIHHKARAKRFLGFQTGDLVRAVITTGKYAGVHRGRVTIRFRPNFQLNGFNVHPKYLTRIHRNDGYTYGEG
jgi:5-methylcytosine-specific restriction endonuclease McrA